MNRYLRIADDIRNQITRGELAAGDRAPSTREVAKKWNVAMATASHALRTLADEGVVESRPRVGTIVCTPPAPVPSAAVSARHEELSVARIVNAAIAIADHQGLAALSLRAVAAKIDSPVMSLYRHVRGKDQLLRAMTDMVLGEERLPESPPEGWRAQLEVGALAEWRTFRRHPWLARVVQITRPEPLPNALVYAEWVLRALGSTGIDAASQLRIHILLHAFVQGMAVNVEAEADAASETGVSDDEWMDGQIKSFESLAASGRYPAFAKVLGAIDDFQVDFDALFAEGLAALLDGFAPLLDGSSARNARAKRAPKRR